MPIDTDSAPGAEQPGIRSSQTADDVMVCHLGRGAGAAVPSGAAIGTTWSQG